MGGLIGGIFQANAANKAAKAQERAATADLNFQKQIYGDTVKRVDPYYKSGLTANNALNFELGLTGTRPEGYQGFQETPGYDFQVQEGLGAVNALAGARGGLNSGATMQALQQRGQGLANQEYNNWLNRVTGVSDTGLSAATLQANAGQNAAAGVSNALGGIGNAQAAGAIGQGNAWTGALTNTLGTWNYQRGLTGGGGLNGSGMGGLGSLFGGGGLFSGLV
jgi:hypothetical protein